MANLESTLRDFGSRVRARRKMRGWSQEELARRTSRHWTYIGGLERGERNPTLRVLLDVAKALTVPVSDLLPGGSTSVGKHPLEEKLGASSGDILTAIEKGFHAQVDVKGKLAELFMSRQLEALRVGARIGGFVWQDKDGETDFLVDYRSKRLRLECKNIRNEVFKHPPSYKVELQRTRNSMDGTPTRGYKVGDFDVIGVSLFNQTGRWDYAYVATKHLERRPNMRDFLVIMQRVPMEIREPWTADPLRAFDDAIGRRK